MMRVLKPDTKEEKLIFENTNFLTSHFFDKKIHFPFMWEVIQADPGIYVLKKSIEIIKSRQYSPPYFRNRVLFNNSNITHEFWKDPYWLHWYEERKNTIENLIQTERIDFKNNPYKDDILLSKNHSEEIEGTQVQLDELNKIIKLSNEYRTLINEVFPDLESEAANNETLKNERKKRIEEKRKQRKTPFDDELLSGIHHAFNGEIWEKISLADFLNSFNGKAKMIKLKTDNGAIRDFCYLIGQIEKRRNKNSVSNFADWVESTFDIKQYKTNKKGERPEVLNKMKPILKKYDTQ